MKTEALTGCAKHRNVKAEALTGKTEALTGCAKHRNVKAEALTGKTEALTGCAKHRNVKAEALTRKTKQRNLWVYKEFYFPLSFGNLLSNNRIFNRVYKKLKRFIVKTSVF
ncbi:hypothetical protein A6769_17820 [Nostoc punctiforme NIES-2108]|uniref:Uncharacterized protein n=1 Tax=Nostoc punctiforme NIES-2108 TaxID=1356359 RepID=A0A367RKC2_NOSPU|nr:hypothetical protein A6769_17820 [Nostoc punctiforme NIES-2108]